MNTQTIDTITRKLTQADAVLSALEALGIESDAFEIPHAEVMANLWAVRDLISEARNATRTPA